jgi:alpha-tubulin suppressor-like RCC1 family protein
MDDEHELRHGVLAAGSGNTFFLDHRHDASFVWGNGDTFEQFRPPGAVKFISAHFTEGLTIEGDNRNVFTFGINNNLRRFYPPCDPRPLVRLGGNVAERRYRPICWRDRPIEGAVGGACGFDFGLVVLEDGRVLGYGSNRFGQLGEYNTGLRDPIPDFIEGLDEAQGVAKVAAGVDFSMFLMRDGSVWSCGNNDRGQLGYDTQGNRNPFPAPIDGLENIVCIACGYYNTLAIRSDGRVFSWGYNLLGLGREIVQRTEPTELNGIYNATDAACGVNHAVILRNDGTVLSFAGALKSPKDSVRRTIGRPVPEDFDVAYPETVPGVDHVDAIACGDFHTTAWVGDLVFIVFGENSDMQFGGAWQGRNVKKAIVDFTRPGETRIEPILEDD